MKNNINSEPVLMLLFSFFFQLGDCLSWRFWLFFFSSCFYYKILIFVVTAALSKIDLVSCCEDIKTESQSQNIWLTFTVSPCSLHHRIRQYQFLFYYFLYLVSSVLLPYLIHSWSNYTVRIVDLWCRGEKDGLLWVWRSCTMILLWLPMHHSKWNMTTIEQEI